MQEHRVKAITIEVKKWQTCPPELVPIDNTPLASQPAIDFVVNYPGDYVVDG